MGVGTTNILRGQPLVKLGSGYTLNNGSLKPILGYNAVDLSQSVAGNSGALADNSFTEGQGTTASGGRAHAEGFSTTASGDDSHAEGRMTTATGIYGAHAEGYQSQATGNSSHAEGRMNVASGANSHAEGENSVASGEVSHASGLGSVAQGFHQTVVGQYNTKQGTPTSKTNTDLAFVLGNGTSDVVRSNALSVDWDGNTVLPTGKVTAALGFKTGKYEMVYNTSENSLDFMYNG